jgi:hypothetical protein
MSTIVATLISAVQPFADWYQAASPVQTGTSFLHFAGLLTSGGFAIATDRIVWRAGHSYDLLARRRALGEIASIHRPVLIGLSIVFVTGAMLTLADVETFVSSPAFWTKMGLVALLLANGALLGKTAQKLSRDPDAASWRWRLLLGSSVASMALWLAVTFAGVMLTNNA